MTPRETSILVVDDEYSVRDSLQSWFRKDGYQVRTAENAEEALQAMEGGRFDVAVIDVRMPGMDGVQLQDHLRQLDARMEVIMITAFASVETAVRSLKQGAFDYVSKPIDPDELSHLVRRALERRRLREENLQLRGTIDEFVAGDTIVGESPPMKKVMELAEHVAKTDATVLIRGESGTGKELIARAIHANSRRRYAPIIPVNCGALPETLLESELFGHEKGAFTGAQYRRKGRLEMADGGTLFLDEVGSISAKTQVDLLRVLETKEFTRIGGTRSVEVDFRVICATNEDLEKAVEDGRFREDFYYRINVFTIEAPPLRARRSDIPLLANHLLHRFARQMDTRVREISPAAMAVLTAWEWPGNVRELSNAIERAMVVGTEVAIQPEDLPVRIGTRRPNERSARFPGRGRAASHQRRARPDRLEHHPVGRDPRDRPGDGLQQDQEVRPEPLTPHARSSVSQWMPVQRRMSSIRHHLVSDDWTRFSPTKAVKRKNHGLTHQPRAREARTNVPAIRRILWCRLMRCLRRDQALALFMGSPEVTTFSTSTCHAWIGWVGSLHPVHVATAAISSSAFAAARNARSMRERYGATFPYHPAVPRPWPSTDSSL